jgi:hypothetical protein
MRDVPGIRGIVRFDDNLPMPRDQKTVEHAAIRIVHCDLSTSCPSLRRESAGVATTACDQRNQYLGWWAKLWNHVLGFSIGYGYKPIGLFMECSSSYC